MPSVKRAGVILIVMGVLSGIAAGAFTVLAANGDLEDTLEDAGYELTMGIEGFAAAMAVQAVISALAIVSGIGVLRRSPAWRIVGIVVASLAAVGGVVNLIVLQNALAVLGILLYTLVVVDLARGGAAFARRAPNS